MNIYILNKSFEIIGVVDSYTSVIWRPAYNEVGDFELYLSASAEAVALLQKDFYLVRDKDVSVVDGVTAYKNVMIIKNFRINTDIENGDFLTITGRELKFLLHSRIVWKQTNLTGTAENGIRRLIDENAINPTNTARVIPGLKLGTAVGFTDKIEKQLTGDFLDEAITEICLAYNYGWDVYISGHALVFELYQGVNRSYSQIERPFVCFSDFFDNISASEYEMQSEGYANVSLCGGEGEGVERIYTTVGNASGLDRHEIFTDAKDISRNAGSEDEISTDQYLLLLDERATEKLAEMRMTEGFEGEIENVSFTYGTDFFMGDIVSIINKYGISKNVQISSVIESKDETGEKTIPQFKN